MKGMEFLFVVAEVSVVYVGFATLIVVVVQQFSGARAEIEVSTAQREALREALRRRLLGDRPDGPFSLRAGAWAVRGTVPLG